MQRKVLEELGACQPRRVVGTPRSLPHTADGSGPASGLEVWWGVVSLSISPGSAAG